VEEPFAPTDEQRVVIESVEENLLVLAAVGCGKTRMLAARIARAIEHGCPPERILALTFTNLAARQVRERMKDTPEVAGVHIRTFHSLCAWILRSDGSAVGVDPEFTIYDEDDAHALMKYVGVDVKAYDETNRDPVHEFHDEASREALGAASFARYRTAAFSAQRWAPAYIEALIERGAVDYAGLVYLSRALLLEDDAVRRRWAGRFDLLCVDEVQDTHLSEYEIVRALAENARSICFLGDVDQTIYQWRGSDPQALIRRITCDFAPIREHAIATNFRATRRLVEFSRRIAAKMASCRVPPEHRPESPEGDDPEVGTYASAQEEYAALAARCRALIEAGTPPARIAVLVRSHAIAEEVAARLARASVPHSTVEGTRVFRRSIVKDMLALTKLVVDRHAESAARRVAARMPEIGAGKGRVILRDAVPRGLRMCDFFDEEIARTGDPFAGFDREDVLVIDTETTGTDAARDEVVEIAAFRLHRWTVAGEFHAFVRPLGRVGASAAIHGYSDAFLRRRGRPADEVFAAFAEFVGGTPVAGHHVRFDREIIESHAARVGVPIALETAFDTLAACRRLHRFTEYRLAAVVREFGIDAGRAHGAYDDARATMQLAAILREELRADRDGRRRLVFAFAPAFASVREGLDRCRAHAGDAAALLDAVIREIDPAAWYREDAAYGPAVASLRARIAATTELAGGPVPVREFLDYAALSTSNMLDHLPGVRVLTVHQAKGMEFDHVFVPALVNGRFPNYFAERDGKLEEEQRLFYVACTRARAGLLLSWHRRDQGYEKGPSPFLVETGAIGTPSARR